MFDKMRVLVKFKYNKDEKIIEDYIQRFRHAIPEFVFDQEYSWLICPPFQTEIFVMPTSSDNPNTPNLEGKYLEEKHRNGYILIRGTLSTHYWKKANELEFVESIYRDANVQFSNSKSLGIQHTRDSRIVNIDTIRRKLGVNKIWNEKFMGQGITVGVVDSGIEINNISLSFPKFNSVIDGYPEADYGSKSDWDEHGNMVALDILAIAPKAKLIDIRITELYEENRISNIVKAYEWALKRYKEKGEPQILTNSWVIYNKYYDLNYAHNDENHPFTNYVEYVMEQGMLVIFCAGNCGIKDKKDKCKDCYGPDKGIWGANSHPNVITVGAVELDLDDKVKAIDYSSVGKGAIGKWKPDLCCFSNFTLKEKSHRGTSVSTPLLAGISALLLQKNPDLKQLQLKEILLKNSVALNPTVEFTFKTGYGVIDAWKAFNSIDTDK